ncbi:MAG: UvrD-helicase domain-containing protein, partial [Patescibacteria group bacterium]
MLENQLNPKQKEAVETTKGSLLVVAGAGAGKTKVITDHIVHLITNCNIPADKILAVTFTNKAAEEMRSRVFSRVEAMDVGRPFIGTFHALGLLMIRENMARFGFDKNFTIIDEDDALKLIKESLLELSIDPKQFDPGRIKNHISKFKNALTTLEQFLENSKYYKQGEDFFGAMTGKIWNLYEQKKKAQNFLDFDDIILLPALELQKDNELLRKYQQRWQYINIDEYQDTNDVQYMISKLLSLEHGNILAVGDIDQAIYSWRGADFKNVLRFQKDYKDAKTITLEENYRSTKIVLDAANAVIERNALRLPKKLWTQKSDGDKIKIFFAENERQEATIISREIKSLCQHKINYKDIAILYRTNAQSRALEEILLQQNIPYRIIGGVKFYERREIKDLLAYVRLVQNASDEISKKRIINTPPRGIGKILSAKALGNTRVFSDSEMVKIKHFEDLIKSLRASAKELTAFQLIQKIIFTTGYKGYINDGTDKGIERWQNIEELLGLAKTTETIDKFLEHISLFSIDDRYDQSSESVSLMTIHSAKGLEFQAVFVAGMEEGLFPHNMSFDPEQLEEERRLYYVAITRAKNYLYLTL